MDLNLLRAFVAVHELASFSLAGERLGVPRSTVSRSVSALEESLGVQLFHRTTRKVTPSSAARALHDRVAPFLLGLEASLAEMPERQEVPSGTLRVTTTADLGVVVLAEAVQRYTARYPAVKVDVHLSNHLVDLTREGFDLALRVSGKALRDSSLVARKVGTVVMQLHGSPAYLARMRAPRTPADLASHDWVVYRNGDPAPFAPQRVRAAIAQRTRVVADDMPFMHAAIRAGVGLGVVPSFLASDDVASGALVRVLPSFVVHTGTAYLVTPSRRIPPKVLVFRELVAELLRQKPLSPSVGQ